MPGRKRGADGKFLSGGSATGGSGDLKPQWLTQSTPVPTSGTDYAVTEILVPRQVLAGFGAATVMEILQVDWYLGLADVADSTTIHFGFLGNRLTRGTDDPVSLVSLQNDVADPTNYAFAMWQTEQFGAGTGAAIMNRSYWPITVTMNDNNGNGMLIATSRFFMTTGAFGNATAGRGTVKILYRMVNVSLEEYVGIVAQQSSS